MPHREASWGIDTVLPPGDLLVELTGEWRNSRVRLNQFYESQIPCTFLRFRKNKLNTVDLIMLYNVHVDLI